jgi:hypothetical protein
MPDEKDAKDVSPTLRKDTRKPYATPQVTTYGNIEEITQSIAGSTTDGINGSLIL